MRQLKPNNKPKKGESAVFLHNGHLQGIVGDGKRTCLEIFEKPAKSKSKKKSTKSSKKK